MDIMSAQTEETVLEYRGERFIQTTWNGISVLKHERTGYYSASDACSIHHKRFEHWLENKSTKEYLEQVSELIQIPIKVMEAGIPASRNVNGLLYHIASGRVGGIDIVTANKISGYYIHPDLFHDVCYWANKLYAFKVSRLMNLINERNKLTNQTLEQTIEKLTAENEALKAKNESKNHRLDEIQATSISRAAKIDELESEIHDLTTPIDRRLAPPTAYAKPIGNDYFQLKVSASILGPNTATLRRESFIGADDCVKQAKKELKKRGLYMTVDNNSVIERSHLDETFNIIHQIKSRLNNETTARNEWLDSEIAKLRAKPSTAQREGKIFELEYIRQHEELTPWALVPIDLKNRLNEMVKDTGIDAVVIESSESRLLKTGTRAGGDAVVIEPRERHTSTNINSDLIVTKIVQVKYKRVSTKPRGNDVRSSELTSFVSKAQQPRYQLATKLLVTKNCNIGPRMRKILESNGINVESY